MEPIVEPLRILATAAVLLAAGGVVGYPISVLFGGRPALRLMVAPVLGLPVLGVAGVALFHLIPLGRWMALAWLAAAPTLAWFAFRRVAAPEDAAPGQGAPAGPHPGWYALAALVAWLVALGVYPQPFGASLGVSAPIYDHMKVAILDEIRQSGLPPRNPYLQQAGSPNLLVYYYLWYALAALGAVVTGATGWEADIALTGLTAFMGMLAMGWLAIRISGRVAAAWWVLPIFLTASWLWVLRFLVGPGANQLLGPGRPIDFWLGQAVWVPQHVFAATTVLLAVLLLHRLLRDSAVSWRGAVVTGLLAAAGFGSSSWVGGIGFAAVACALVTLEARAILAARTLKTVLGNLLFAGSVALGFAFVWLQQQFMLVSDRRAVAPWIFPALTAEKTLGGAVQNVVGFWTVFLPLDLGFAYIASIVFFARCRGTVGLPRGLLLVICVVPLLVMQFLQSVIGNNDLGWRVVLIAMLALAAVGAAFATEVLESGSLRARQFLHGAVVVLLVPAVLSGLTFLRDIVAGHRLYGAETEQSRRFMAAPAMWEDVRRLVPPDAAVANNPEDLATVTPWPANIGWALLAQRRNCMASWEGLRAYSATLTPTQRDVVVYPTFVRIFRGEGGPDDFRRILEEHNCRWLLVQRSDGLWHRGREVLEQYFRPVADASPEWRLYRAR